MTKSVLVCLLMAAPALAGAAGSPTAAATAADEQAIARIQDEWRHAHFSGDVKTMDRVETDDFTVAGDFGIETKQDQLAGLRRRADSGKPSAKVDLKVDDRRFQFLGDVALVTQIDHYGDGREYECSEVWVRAGESWRVNHLHYTLVAKKP